MALVAPTPGPAGTHRHHRRAAVLAAGAVGMLGALIAAGPAQADPGLGCTSRVAGCAPHSDLPELRRLPDPEPGPSIDPTAPATPSASPSTEPTTPPGTDPATPPPTTQPGEGGGHPSDDGAGPVAADPQQEPIPAERIRQRVAPAVPGGPDLFPGTDPAAGPPIDRVGPIDEADPAGDAFEAPAAPQAAGPRPVGTDRPDLGRPLFYSGLAGLTVAAIGLAFVGWRRRLW